MAKAASLIQERHRTDTVALYEAAHKVLTDMMDNNDECHRSQVDDLKRQLQSKEVQMTALQGDCESRVSDLQKELSAIRIVYESDSRESAERVRSHEEQVIVLDQLGDKLRMEIVAKMAEHEGARQKAAELEAQVLRLVEDAKEATVHDHEKDDQIARLEALLRIAEEEASDMLDVLPGTAAPTEQLQPPKEDLAEEDLLDIMCGGHYAMAPANPT